tara:strand:+ start:47147 stop:47302 length:156 start_codon:yes stop_codon:yes gene_type:complete
MSRARVKRKVGSLEKTRPSQGRRMVKRDADKRQLAGTKAARVERKRRRRTI